MFERQCTKLYFSFNSKDMGLVWQKQHAREGGPRFSLLKNDK
jgi:hypothetical protein